MKKIFSSLLLIFVLFGNQAVRADNMPQGEAPTGELTMERGEDLYFKIFREHPEWFKQISKNTAINSFLQTITLAEDQANTPDHPIPVLLNQDIQISLQGEESNSEVYCSGAGDQHGYRWEYDNGDVDNDVLMMTSSPTGTIHTFFPNGCKMTEGWKKKKTSYNWSFFPKKSGLTTLTFKKYYYSNAMVRNLDGSLPWKDPVKTIRFTIQVVDDTPNSANNN